MTEEEFRRELQTITTGRSAALWPEMINALRDRFPHRIYESHQNILAGFNCFAYALRLNDSASYLELARETEEPNVFADTAFVEFLLSRSALEDAAPGREQVVIYFRDGRPEHAGRLIGDRVVSKWGTGKWFEHGIWEVPAGYGSVTRFYASSPLEIMESEFLEYVRARGHEPEYFLDLGA